jgi:tetratricopeptide (TPR) repeat protein
VRPILSSCVLLLSLACASPRAGVTPGPAEALPFIEDDYPKALSEARARHLPLFVDTWAPWCHSCRSMRAFVFTDKALARHAGRFVWLAIDTERPESAAFLEKFPVEVWPTLFVVNPTTEKAALRWLGTATVPQLEALLEDGERAMRGDGPGMEAKLARADKLYAEGKAADAVPLLRELLSTAPEGWARRARTVESLLGALQELDQHEACSQLARAELPRLPRSPSWSNAAMSGLFCALEVPKDAPGRKEAIDALEKKVQESLAPPLIEMAADDRSGLYLALLSVRDSAGDAEGKKRIAGEWATFLEGEAGRAETPAARTVFDSHLMSAYLALGQPERALPMLERSERDLPDDYNPPARKAVIYRELKRYDEALAANDRALARVYGPRKIRVLVDRAETLAAKGDRGRARKTLEDALAYARSLPASQVRPTTVAAVQKKLDGFPVAP